MRSNFHSKEYLVSSIPSGDNLRLSGSPAVSLTRFVASYIICGPTFPVRSFSSVISGRLVVGHLSSSCCNQSGPCHQRSYLLISATLNSLVAKSAGF